MCDLRSVPSRVTVLHDKAMNGLSSVGHGTWCFCSSEAHASIAHCHLFAANDIGDMRLSNGLAKRLLVDGNTVQLATVVCSYGIPSSVECLDLATSCLHRVSGEYLMSHKLPCVMSSCDCHMPAKSQRTRNMTSDLTHRCTRSSSKQLMDDSAPVTRTTLTAAAAAADDDDDKQQVTATNSSETAASDGPTGSFTQTSLMTGKSTSVSSQRRRQKPSRLRTLPSRETTRKLRSRLSSSLAKVRVKCNRRLRCGGVKARFHNSADSRAGRAVVTADCEVVMPRIAVHRRRQMRSSVESDAMKQCNRPAAEADGLSVMNDSQMNTSPSQINSDIPKTSALTVDVGFDYGNANICMSPASPLPGNMRVRRNREQRHRRRYVMSLRA